MISVITIHQLKDNLSSQEYIHRYIRPIPRFDLSKILLKFASSAIDISDGLVQDLGHLCTASKVGAKINFDQIPFPLNSSEEDKRKFKVSSNKFGWITSFRRTPVTSTSKICTYVLP